MATSSRELLGNVERERQSIAEAGDRLARVAVLAMALQARTEAWSASVPSNAPGGAGAECHRRNRPLRLRSGCVISLELGGSAHADWTSKSLAIRSAIYRYSRLTSFT
jgi:hypothetical protein